MPFDIARAGNRDGIVHYLSLARELYEQTRAIERETEAQGGDSPGLEPIMSIEEAERKAWDMFDGVGGGAGEKALEFAHAYWQSLKHPWHDQALESHGRAMAAVRARDKAERARLDALAGIIDSTFNIQVGINHASFDAAGASPEHSWHDKIRECAAAILEAADPADIVRIREVIASLERSDPRRQWLTLDSLRIALTNEARERAQARALAAYRERQQAALTERMIHLLDSCAKRVSNLETARAAQIEATLTEIRTQLSSGNVGVADEERLQNLSQCIDAEIRGQGILEAAVAELNRLGYKAVHVMESLGPPDITSVYLQDPGDEERLTLLQVSGQGGLLSGEIVRREKGAGSSRDRQADQSAQSRLCKALEAVETALGSRWELETRSNTPPGAAPRVDPSVPRTRKRLRSVSGARTRHLGAS